MTNTNQQTQIRKPRVVQNKRYPFFIQGETQSGIKSLSVRKPITETQTNQDQVEKNSRKRLRKTLKAESGTKSPGVKNKTWETRNSNVKAKLCALKARGKRADGHSAIRSFKKNRPPTDKIGV
jgi:hypothetical protein